MNIVPRKPYRCGKKYRTGNNNPANNRGNLGDVSAASSMVSGMPGTIDEGVTIISSGLERHCEDCYPTTQHPLFGGCKID